MPEHFTNDEGTKGYSYWTLEAWEKAFDDGSIVDHHEKRHAEGYKAARFTIVSDEHPKDGYEHGVYGEFWLDADSATEDFEFPRRASA